MAKLYDAYEHPKEQKKRDKVKYRHRRFYTKLDMSILKHDEAVQNAQKKRGEVKSAGNGIIYECGCGCRGCFIHRDWESSPNQVGLELLKNIFNKSKPTKPKKDEANEYSILRNGFDTKTSFRR